MPRRKSDNVRNVKFIGGNINKNVEFEYEGRILHGRVYKMNHKRKQILLLCYEEKCFYTIHFSKLNFELKDISEYYKLDDDYDIEPPGVYEASNTIYYDDILKMKYIISIGWNEVLEYPHMHIFRSYDDYRQWKNGACLSLIRNEYYDHSNNRERLSKDELKEIVELLNLPNKDNPKRSNWEELISYWNDTHYTNYLPLDISIPEYDIDSISL